MGVFISFGMDTLLVKEIARDPKRTSDLLSSTISTRTLLFFLSCGIIALYARLAHFAPSTIVLIALLGVAQFVTQIYLAIQSALQGLELMQYVSIANVLSRIVNTLLGIIVLILGYSVYGVGVITIFAMASGLIVQHIYLRQRYSIFFSFDVSKIRQMLRTGLPYLASSLGLVAYGQIDILIISALINSTQVGWYSSASRLFGTLMFFPVIFTTAIFPSITRLHKHSPNELPYIIQKSFNLMLVLSMPIGLGLLVIAKPLVALLYGASFAPSAPILALLGLVIIPTYQNILLGQFLTSTDRQNGWTIVMLGATAATLPLDIILVPWCQSTFNNGAIAGGLSFLITEIVMVFIGTKLLPKGALNKGNIATALRIFFAGCCMALITWLLSDLFILVPILAGAAVYISIIVITRTIPAEDILLVRQFAVNIVRRMRGQQNNPILTEG